MATRQTPMSSIIRSKIEVEGVTIDIPVKYPDAQAVMVFLSVSKKKLEETLGTQRLKPISIFKGRSVLGITIFNYRKSPVGVYRELALSVPVLLDSRISIPILPLKFDSFFKNFGFYTLSLAMDTKLGIAHSEQIFGYPTHKSIINIDIDDKYDYISINVKDDKHKILYLSAHKGKYLKSGKKTFITYFKKNERLMMVRMDAKFMSSRSSGRKDTKLEFGQHRIVDLLSDLDAGDQILEVVYYDRAFEVLHAPIEIGSL